MIRGRGHNNPPPSVLWTSVSSVEPGRIEVGAGGRTSLENQFIVDSGQCPLPNPPLFEPEPQSRRPAYRGRGNNRARHICIAVLILLGTASLGFGAATTVPVVDSLADQPIHRDQTTAIDSAKDARLQPVPIVEAWRVAAALAIVLGLIIALRFFAKWFFPGAAAHRSTNAVQVLSRCTISPKQHLLVIQIGRRLLLVADCATQLNCLCQITDGEEVAALIGQLREETISSARRFDLFFGRARKAFGTDDESADGESQAKEGEQSSASFDSSHEIPDAAIASTQQELQGLSSKVRELVQQLTPKL